MTLTRIRSALPILLAFCLSAPAISGNDLVKVGAGAYALAAKSFDKDPPAAPFRSGVMLQRAVPTNQWYSSLAFSATPVPIYAIPLSFKAAPQGFEMGLPGKRVVPTERKDVEIHYPHQAALVFSPTAFEPAPATLDKVSDWSIDILQARGADQMRVTVAHGSPYAYFRVSRGDVRLRLAEPGTPIASDDPRILAMRTGGAAYAVFGPSGVRWEQVSQTEWLGRLPEGKGYFSAAALPDASAASLARFSRHAYAFIEDSRVQWRYDQAASKVTTTFQLDTRTMEGADHGALLGLYPHHWIGNTALADRTLPGFDSLRGPVRLLAANQFSTEYAYHGFVPFWPAIRDPARREQLDELMRKDLGNANRMSRIFGNGSYWQGKGLARIGELMSVVEQQGNASGRDKLMDLLKTRMQDWFSGDDGKTYFRHDARLGSLLAYPEEYSSVTQMNDHHFHYGYWIRAAVQVALRDPAWAARERWGGMIDKLVADIATSERGRVDYPFLRNFDPYEGHSWASGIGLGEFGNNQESSSEAVNAWAGIILWGEINGDRALRDLGLYLYTTEIEAINNYWFDLNRQVLAPEYKNVEVSMLFGGKYAHNTWWIDEPRQIHGINLLPITAASTYLGRDPGFVKRNLDALPGESEAYAARGRRPDPVDIWQDIFAKYLALADPQAGLARWDRWGAVELGDSRTQTLHWLASLAEMGVPDPSVLADTPLYAVFKRADGKKTYLAYNAGKAPLGVRFSDGKVLAVAPASLARSD